MRGSSVCGATGYGLDGRGSIPDRGKEFFSAAQRPDRLWCPPSLLSNGVEWPDREADHLHPSSAEAKNGGAVCPLPHTSSWRVA
jgi:hypothetical protein